MSHVDEGTLHAYWDGALAPEEAQGVAAHLAQCPACRARLEEERALIARADELLGLAAPPERALPPFRAGDVTPPTRLWWQVRWPLAWAATVLLALRIGMYVATPLQRPVASLSDRVEPSATPSASAPRSPEHAGPAPLARTSEDRGARLLAPPAGATVSSRVAPRAARPDQPSERGRADLVVPTNSLVARVRPDTAAREPAEARAAPAASLRALLPAVAPEAPGVTLYERRPYVIERAPLERDSARALLGADPFVIPDLAVRGIYRARFIGYSAAVVVEQALDASRVVTVMTARPVSAPLAAVVAIDAARADSVGLRNEAPRRRALPARDSAAPMPRPWQAALRPTSAAAVPGGLEVEVRGPLPPDSLAALRRRVQPLPP